MKVKVIRTFRDKDNFDLIYNVGEILDLDDERAKELIILLTRRVIMVIKKTKKRS